MVKSLPAMQETRLWSLGQEDPLEKGMGPVFLPGEFHGQRGLTIYYSPWDPKELDVTEQLTLGEGGGSGDRNGEYMYIHGLFMSIYDKNHYNIVK